MSDKEQIEAAKAAYNNATPGEWKYCGCNRCQLVWGDGLLVHDEPDGDDGDVPTPRDSTGINNAILIAAAPALMRRVQELEDWQRRALPWFDWAMIAIRMQGCDTQKEIAKIYTLITDAKE